ncbi:MAG: endonuclease/exonuclease/phosphatase family protein [Bacteroidota bacterium]
MNRSLRYILYLLLIVLFFIVGFYFWASSPNFSETEYTQIKTNQFSSKTNTDSIFSIITYNIGYLSGMTNNLPVKKSKIFFENNLKLVKAQYKNLNADILAFQEIDFASKRSYDLNQQDKIATLGYNYIAQAINWDKKYLPFPEFPISMHYGRILSGQSVLSKFPILDHQRIELERNPTNPFYYDAFYIDRLAQVVQIQINNKKVIVINVHLEAYHKETRLKQTHKIIEIYNQYSQKFPTLLVGDFNSDIKYENASIKLLLNIPKIGNAVYNNDNPKTFNSVKPTERLDYIFYNTDFIEYISGRLLTEFKQASDHLPLLMQFKYKKHGRITNTSIETP